LSILQVKVRALETLDLVARYREKTSSLTEVANSVQLNQAACANIIKTQVDKNYLKHAGH
jgi:DNA-binding IclR family transcriptional regulator